MKVYIHKKGITSPAHNVPSGKAHIGVTNLAGKANRLIIRFIGGGYAQQNESPLPWHRSSGYCCMSHPWDSLFYLPLVLMLQRYEFVFT